MNSPQIFDAAENINYAEPVLVIGAGGHAKVMIQILRELGAKISGVLDDDPTADSPDTVEYLGPIAQLGTYERPQAVIAIGDNASRRRVADRFDARWLTLIHPSSFVAPSARLGRGVVVCANATICVDAKIGDHTIINTNTSVDHDTVIGEFAHIACGVTLAGGVVIGDDVLIGAGATILPFVSVGDHAIVGAGSVATRNIERDCVAYGVPARRVRGR